MMTLTAIQISLKIQTVRSLRLMTDVIFFSQNKISQEFELHLQNQSKLHYQQTKKLQRYPTNENYRKDLSQYDRNYTFHHKHKQNFQKEQLRKGQVCETSIASYWTKDGGKGKHQFQLNQNLKTGGGELSSQGSQVNTQSFNISTDSNINQFPVSKLPKQKQIASSTPTDQSTRSIRGLRVLSLKVRDIVYKRKQMTYKQVAETLIKQIAETTNTVFKGKEEQNVKRRVYDALNVLIAANVLRKDGKTVFCDSSIDIPSDANQRIYNKTERVKLQKTLNDREQYLNAKKQMLQDLIYKTLAIKNLINKNRQLEDQFNKSNQISLIKDDENSNSNQMPTSEDSTKDSNKIISDPSNKIDFPFIIVTNRDPENGIQVQVNADRSVLQIESQKKLLLFGELDVLLVMKHHYMPRKYLNQHIDEQLIKYLPQEYLKKIKEMD